MAIEMLYFGGIVFIKISILFFYRRLASRQISQAFVWWVRVAIASVIVYALVFGLVIVFTYSPAGAYWNILDPVWLANNDFKWKLDEGAIIVSLSVISTLQDFVICALPAVLVRNLQIHARQKIGLMAIFGLGLL